MSLHKKRVAQALAGTAALALLAGCAGASDSSASGESGTAAGGGGDIVIGTTDKVVSLDPAGSFDNGSFAVQVNVFPFLMAAPEGSSAVAPDIAESASFTRPTEYTVKLKPGL